MTSCGNKLDPPRPLRAAEELTRNNGRFVIFLAALLVLCVVIVFLGKRRRHVLAAGAFSLLRINYVMFFASLVLFLIAAGIGPGTVRFEKGMFLGLLTLGCLVLIELVRGPRIVLQLARYLREHPLWPRRNRWLLPIAVLNLAVAGAAVIGSVLLIIESGCVEGLLDTSSSFDVPAILAFFLWCIVQAVILAWVAWGLWERQTWACWTHLYCGLPLIVWLTGMGVAEWPDVWLTVWYVPALVAAITWWLYGFIAGYRLSAHWLQRGRCWQCGRIRWMRAARCDVCGERYRLFKDRAAAPACLACGHEHQDAMPVCRTCRTAKT
ncbi:MAG: hypothetical protein GWP05_06830 [Anaerolineaceae bacterium]|nr:hypothetical protein [Anaerolineaceae bacterium]